MHATGITVAAKISAVAAPQYRTMPSVGVATPIRKLHIDYVHPLSYPETASVEALLHWSEAARVNYEFIVRCADGTVATTGYTVQMMLDSDRNILMAPPPFIMEIREEWLAGSLEKRDRTPKTRLVHRTGPLR